jgi:hypothetical protein
MRSRFRILLIAIFLTASYRLVPFPLGDTVRGALVAVFVIGFSVSRGGRLNISFFKEVWPLFVIMFLTLLVDILLGRTGTLLVVIWAQFLSAMLVASSVYTLTLDEVRHLIVVSIGLLLVQLALISLAPDYFIMTAQMLGIVDPFVSHGRAIERMYYAYFNANSASYAIYYMLLSFFALGNVAPISRGMKMLVVGALLFLIFLTGGRGVILLTAGFFFAWYLSFRSTGAAIFAGIASMGWIIALPLVDAVKQLILLREISNLARLEAMASYLGIVRDNPIFGLGVQSIRERVEELGFLPSHNFFLEILGYFGVLLGGSLLVYLIYKTLICSTGIALKVVGLFALAVGFFNNTLLTHWGFFPLLFPVLIVTSTAMRERLRASGRRALAGRSATL